MTAAAGLWLLMAQGASAAPHGAPARPVAPDAGAPAPQGGDEFALLVARQGTIMRARLENGRLVAREASGAVLSSRELTPAERQQLLEAGRAALTDDAPQWSCPVDETFLAVTVDGRTQSSAVCPERNRWRAHPELWQRLLALVRRLLGVSR